MAKIFSYLWPQSLYRQILLVVALALLVAQIINAALLLNGAKNRSSTEAASLLVGRIAAQSDRQIEQGRSWSEFIKRQEQRQRIASVTVKINPSRFSPPDFVKQDGFTKRAQEFLGQSDSGLSEVEISSGPIANLPTALLAGPMQSRFARRIRSSGQDFPDEAILLTAKTSSGQWISAAALVRPRESGAIVALLLQTLTLYIAVMVPLALVANRIVKPLERLTERVRRVGLTDEIAPLESEGPSDIRNLVDSFNVMQARVSNLLGEKDVMLGAIGHDLKTPLAALRVRVESVEDEGERQKMADTIDEMVTILDDILTLARLGKSGEAKQNSDIGALVESVADEFLTGGAKVRMDDPQSRILASVRPVLLRRALRNLIGNAIKHAGNADISLYQQAGNIFINIDDAGPGINTEHIEDMFIPFTRMETSRNRTTGGSGLGLTISRAIARAHGGDVRIENRTEGGLRASIILPV